MRFRIGFTLELIAKLRASRVLDARTREVLQLTLHKVVIICNGVKMLGKETLRSELRFAGIDMSIRFKCKSCEMKYELPEAFAGKMAECVKCHNTIQVPVESEIPPAPPGSNPSKQITCARAVPALDVFQPDRLIRKVKCVGETKNAKTIQKEEDVVFRCRTCGQKYRLDKKLAGRAAECSKCENTIIIPTVSDSEFIDPPARSQGSVRENTSIGQEARRHDADSVNPNETMYEINRSLPPARKPASD